MSMQTLNTRLNYMGGSTLGRINKTKLDGLHAALANDYNSRLIKVPHKEAFRCLINTNNLKPDYDKKIISVDFDSQLHEGDVFEILDDGTHWMIYLPVLTETAYLKAEIIRCRYTLEVEDEEYWVYFQGPTETDLRWFIKNDINYNELNLSGTIYIKDTPITRNFFTRFQHIKIEGHVWEIQVTDYISVPGIIELEVQEYYDNPIEELPEVIKEDENTYIMGKTLVEQGTVYGYEISSEVYNPEYEWSVEDNPRVSIKKVLANGRICQIKVPDGTIGEFKVVYGNKTTGYHLDVKIDIEEPEIKGPDEVYPYDTHTYYVEDDEGGFWIETRLAKVIKIDDSAARVEILTGKKGSFNLYFRSNISDKVSILPITIKSF